MRYKKGNIMRQQNETSKRDKTPALKKGVRSLLNKIANALRLIKDSLKGAQGDHTQEKKGGALELRPRQDGLKATRVVFLQDGRRAQKIRAFIQIVPTPTKQKQLTYSP